LAFNKRGKWPQVYLIEFELDSEGTCVDLNNPKIVEIPGWIVKSSQPNVDVKISPDGKILYALNMDGTSGILRKICIETRQIISENSNLVDNDQWINGKQFQFTNDNHILLLSRFSYSESLGHSNATFQPTNKLLSRTKAELKISKFSGVDLSELSTSTYDLPPVFTYSQFRRFKVIGNYYIVLDGGKLWQARPGE